MWIRRMTYTFMYFYFSFGEPALYLCMKILQSVLMTYDHESLFVSLWGFFFLFLFLWDQVRSNVIGSDPQALLFLSVKGVY